MAVVTFLILLLASFETLQATYPSEYKEKIIVKREACTSNCYGDLGCFCNDPPYDNTLFNSVPKSPTEIGTSFSLYTRSNPTNKQILVAGDRISVTSSNFEADHNTVFIIHGYKSSEDKSWVKELTDALLRKTSMNVVSVDWKDGADHFLYDQSAANARVVGAQVAQLITFLNEQTGTFNRQYHIIGHSLGAHVAGYAGHELPDLRRISGLDPARPCFHNKDVLVRLDARDATFVDVIHTDVSPFPLGYGMAAIGDVDFYPNSGQSQQPGCSGFLQHKCDHGRAIHLYIESINSDCQFTAYPCASESQWESQQCESCGTVGCSNMGFSVNPNTTPGKYYLYTSSSPFCAYLYRFNMLLSAHQGYSYGVVVITLYGTNGNSPPIERGPNKYRKDEKHSVRALLSTDIGDITRVLITFKKGSGLLAWSSSRELKIGEIDVVNKWGQRRSKNFDGSVVLKDSEAQSFAICPNLDSC